MALFSKVFSCLSKSRATVRHCHSGPRLAVEELKKRHGFGPWLMFADAENDETGGKGGVRRCYSLLSGEIFSLPAPQLQGRRCWGTQYGWLITFSPSSGDVRLFNPLTHNQLPLPRRRDDKFAGFSLSSDSHDDRLVVMSVYGCSCQLAFSSPGDEAWKYIHESRRSEAYSDTIFYRGQFYTFDCLGNLKVVCDITTSTSQEKLITTFCAQRPRGFGFYLVEISGHLYLIQRAYVLGPYVWEGLRQTIKTKSVDIYRFDFQQTKWIAMDDLDGHAVFVGNNTTFAVSATDYPEINPNCIYFTDKYSTDYEHPFCDMGVYDFATKALVDAVPFIKQNNSPYSTISRPFFFIPSLSDL